MAGTDADHATIAVNAEGDIFVCWQTARPDLSGTENIKQVEGVFIPRVGQQGWDTPTISDVVVLGDPSLGVLGASETCRKPDVVAVGNNFVVTWPRNIPGGGMGQIEAAHIVRGANGTFTVDSEAPGRGYVVDPNVLSGDAGMMPDLVELTRADDLAGVVYVHETLNTGGPNADREYDIRFALIDFGVSPPNITGPTNAVSGLPMDDGPTGPPGGGLVLPDIVEDDFGRLVLAYETYSEFIGTYNATIEVKRYSEISGLLLELDGYTFTSFGTHNDPVDPANRLRRPNLSSSRNDVKNAVSITWMEIEAVQAGDVQSWHYDLNFQGGAASGPVVVVNLGFDNNQRRTQHPVPVTADQMRLALAVHNLPAQDVVAASAPIQFNGLKEMPTTFTLEPVRPAADVWELQPSGERGRRIIPVCYEAVPTLGTVSVIYLVVHRV